MGRAAVDTNILFFDGWSIPAEDRIGEEGEGFKASVSYIGIF
jgi:alkylation response protein AidB-like acyl-CoA dehydrogenase